MGLRRKARELALQALFAMDMTGQITEEKLKQHCLYFKNNQETHLFFMELTKGVIEHQSKIDALITKFSENWKLFRINGIDRNAMRIAMFEMLFKEDIPLTVSINEAIDLGKKFGTCESGSFINGILDAVRIELTEKNDIMED